MSEILSLAEKSVGWIVLLVCTGLVTYLFYNYYRKAKLRRWYHRHRARHPREPSDEGARGDSRVPRP